MTDLLRLTQAVRSSCAGRQCSRRASSPGTAAQWLKRAASTKGKPKRAMLRVKLRQLPPLVRAQMRLGGERPLLQLTTRQVRVAAQDTLLACGEAQTPGGSGLPSARRGGEDGEVPSRQQTQRGPYRAPT